ncbi:hypothetical protein CO178_01520 [candidate division WWE3 bacterium CG_4_9_14_3_um_filter_34_6]|uniref:PIN domain-containing protein n=1 Tax=candidate division WWE3 bacterium CG_4_9_14_3_um_filter_34_6 TaxID=1975079 RepID=A0A2M7X3P8_UNCKA|nr:MAG: hypothetical protein CO178_01520 [candidate division WWE3 bacterium CG_4_9_14_3_um_filter_34_6]
MNTPENNIYLVDTNIFLRAIVKDDESSFKDCIKFLEGIKNGKFNAITTSVILSEIVWTLLSFYKLEKHDVILAIASIINLKGLNIVDQYNHINAIEIFTNKNVKYIDTLIASTAMSVGKKCVIVSYDKDFDKIGIERKEPHEIRFY